MTRHTVMFLGLLVFSTGEGKHRDEQWQTQSPIHRYHVISRPTALSSWKMLR